MLRDREGREKHLLEVLQYAPEFGGGPIDLEEEHEYLPYFQGIDSPAEGWTRLTAVARALGVTYGRVRTLCRQGVLEGKRFRDGWHVRNLRRSTVEDPHLAKLQEQIDRIERYLDYVAVTSQAGGVFAALTFTAWWELEADRPLEEQRGHGHE